MDVLDDLVAAAYSRDRRELLEHANGRLHQVRYLVRMSNDLQLMPRKSYEYAAERIDEIGRMIGGWLRGQRGGGR
jgi:hypothetical protein